MRMFIDTHIYKCISNQHHKYLDKKLIYSFGLISLILRYYSNLCFNFKIIIYLSSLISINIQF